MQVFFIIVLKKTKQFAILKGKVKFLSNTNLRLSKKLPKDFTLIY